MIIKQLLEDFCMYSKYIRGVSDQTIKRYNENIMNFSRSQNISQIEEITEKQIQDFFIQGRIRKNWSVQTFHTYRLSLIVFLRWCVKNGHLSENYAEKLEKPKKEKLLPKRLKMTEAQKLLEVAANYPYTQTFLRYRNHALMAIFIYAGLRMSEALNLSQYDVDTENRTISIRRGKGNRDRIVPMNTVLSRILISYQKERQKQKKTSTAYFVASNRDAGFTKNGLKLMVQTLKNASGISFTIHKLRHTFATLMVEGGCDIFSLSKMMGHSDIKTTTIYLSASADHLKEQMTKHPMNLTY